MRKFFTAVLMAVLASLAVLGVRTVEQPKLDDLQGQQAVLRQQSEELEEKLAAAKAAGEIKTDGWMQYCDPLTALCFEYPKDWTLSGGAADRSKTVTAMLTSPDKSMTIRYASPLVKDGGYDSSHIVKKSDMSVADTPLAVVGAYPVSFGVYQPIWTVLGRETAKDMTPGKVSRTVVSPRFDVGKNSSLSLTGTGPAFKSAAQTEAWFDSLDGKTMEAILSSFGAK